MAASPWRPLRWHGDAEQVSNERALPDPNWTSCSPNTKLPWDFILKDAFVHETHHDLIQRDPSLFTRSHKSLMTVAENRAFRRGEFGLFLMKKEHLKDL